MYDKYFIVNSLTNAIDLLSKYSDTSKIIAGGTDLILEMKRGKHSGVKEIIDISRIGGLDQIHLDKNNQIHIGPLVTHSTCLRSELIKKKANCLYQACEQVGSPQIRNRGTIVGNIVTASPANDTISALLALDASVELSSKEGKRLIPIDQFFVDIRKTVIKPDEMVTDIVFSALGDFYQSCFVKNALRQAQAISLVNISVVVKVIENVIEEARIALGAVSPIVLRATEAENFLKGKTPSESVFNQAAKIAAQASSPISDIRASQNYRREMVAVQVKRALQQTILETDKEINHAVVLWGKETSANKPINLNGYEMNSQSSLIININDEEHEIRHAFEKTLLDMLRENALLTGTKEGCGEGECGACTVFMDGVAVLACLIPAPRACNTRITTIEGIAKQGEVHKVQQSFIEEGAVQCGYCTPGFIMSAVKLLEENNHPTENEIKIGISGNLCRCTGYYKIIKAIENAAER